MIDSRVGARLNTTGLLIGPHSSNGPTLSLIVPTSMTVFTLTVLFPMATHFTLCLFFSSFFSRSILVCHCAVESQRMRSNTPMRHGFEAERYSSLGSYFGREFNIYFLVVNVIVRCIGQRIICFRDYRSIYIDDFILNKVTNHLFLL